MNDIETSSAWVAKALTASGYRADFSLRSLAEIDRFFDEHSENGEARPGGLLSEKIGSRLFAIGAYVGEVVRRTVGGAWSADDADPEGEIKVELRLPDGGVIWPVQRVIKRFRNGSEDGIAAYGHAFAGAQAAAESKRPWWKFWASN